MGQFHFRCIAEHWFGIDDSLKNKQKTIKFVDKDQHLIFGNVIKITFFWHDQFVLQTFTLTPFFFFSIFDDFIIWNIACGANLVMFYLLLKHSSHRRNVNNSPVNDSNPKTANNKRIIIIIIKAKFELIKGKIATKHLLDTFDTLDPG